MEDFIDQSKPISFSEEELRSINDGMTLFASICNSDAPEGMTTIIPTTLKDKLIAFYLRDYVLQLQRERATAIDPSEVRSLTRQALFSQTKVLSIHRLPIYVFEIACMYMKADDRDGASEMFRSFLRGQAEYTPNDEDEIILRQISYDLPEMIQLAVENSF